MNDPATRKPAGSSEPAHAAGLARPTPPMGPEGQRSGNGSEEHFRPERRTDHPEPVSAHTDRSAASLLRQLMDDAALLVRKELALAASEIRESVDEAKRGSASLVSGGAVLYAGLLFLLGAAAMGLAQFMPLWAAVLTIGVVVTLIGFVMLRSGKKKLEPGNFVPERTTDSLRKDKQAIRRHTP